MIQYKDGIFCQQCGTLLQIPLIEDFFNCLQCQVKYPINSIQYQTFTTEKIYPQKEWLQKKEEAKQKVTQTIEQKCQNPKCDSNLCFYTAKQIRSADEGQTVFYTCVKCSEKFAIHNQLKIIKFILLKNYLKLKSSKKDF